MQNRDDVLKILKQVISSDKKRLLEFYAGDENYAKYFASHFKKIEWVSSNIMKQEFPKFNCDIIFTADTFDIMDWKQCKSWMKTVGTRLREGSQVIICGSFNTAGTRSTDDINRVMSKNGLALYNDFDLSLNNHILVYTRLIFMKDIIKQNK